MLTDRSDGSGPSHVDKRPGSSDRHSAETSHAHIAPPSPPARPSLHSLSDPASPSSSSTRFGSSPDKIYQKTRPQSADPLFAFRADAGAMPPPPCPPRERSPPHPNGSSEEDMLGIEDITMSQWEACPSGRKSEAKSDGPASGPLLDIQEGEENDFFDDSPRPKGRRKEGAGGGTPVARSTNRRLVSPTPSESPSATKDGKIRNSSPISASRSDDLDQYDVTMIDDRSPATSDSIGELQRLPREKVKRRRVLSDDSDEGEASHTDGEGLGGSDGSDTETTATHEVGSDEEASVLWDPSPLSPRSRERRNTLSSPSSCKRKIREDTDSLILSMTSPGKRGNPGPSTVRSARTSTRAAAVNARARVKNYIVLSDTEDGDFDPAVGGAEKAFVNEYKKQIGQEALEPEETDGSEPDDEVLAWEENPGRDARRLAFEREQEDGDDFSMVEPGQPSSSTRKLVSKPPAKDKPNPPAKARNTNLFEALDGVAGPSRPAQLAKAAPKPSAPAEPGDEYDVFPDDFFDGIDLDELSNSLPSNKSATRPANGLAELFPPSPPRRPTSAARVPLRDLPTPNLAAPSWNAPASRSRLLDRLDDAENDAYLDSNDPAAIIAKHGFMPVSLMPPKWRDFYQNHWRRGADKSAARNRFDEDEEQEEVEVPAKRAAPAKRPRAPSATRGARGRGGAKGSGRTLVDDDGDEEEEDYEGDLGGPSRPKSSARGRGFGRARSWMRGRGGGGRRGGGRKR